MIDTAPNWKVYRLIFDLIKICRWGDQGCKYFRRLSEIATECVPVPEETGVYDILSGDNPPTPKQANLVATVLAKQATEMHWQPQKAMPKFSLFWLGLKQWF